MTAFERDAVEVEALLTDRYLESVLARVGDATSGPADAALDPALRLASDRLRRDLVRVHPSFRFEERLAARLAEAAAALRMPAAVGAEGSVIPFVAPGALGRRPSIPLAFDDPTTTAARAAPAAAHRRRADVGRDLAGRRGVRGLAPRPHPGARASPMARAARAVQRRAAPRPAGAREASARD